MYMHVAVGYIQNVCTSRTLRCLMEFQGWQQLSHHAMVLCVSAKSLTHTHTHTEQMTHSQKHKRIFHLKIPDG